MNNISSPTLPSKRAYISQLKRTLVYLKGDENYAKKKKYRN